jgi:uncharacterized protein
MELTNEFVIDRGVEETWKILNDLEFIAPCMPGAQLQEIEGDEYRGIVKVKVGPITAQYKGKASFVEQDATAKVTRLKAEGRDPRQGNANAIITASMVSIGDTQTTVKIHTDLGLSGKIASFGRGAIEDVSKKILGQFTENLREKLETGGSADGAVTTEPASSSTSAAPAVSVPGASATQTPAPGADRDTSTEAVPKPVSSSASQSSSSAEVPSTQAAPSEAVSASGEPVKATLRKIDSPEAKPVDLLAVSGGTLAKRLVPAAGGLAAIIIFLYWLLGRG